MMPTRRKGAATAALMAAVLLSAGCGSAPIEKGSGDPVTVNGDGVLFPGEMPAGVELLRAAVLPGPGDPNNPDDLGWTGDAADESDPVLVVAGDSDGEARAPDRVVVCAWTWLDDPLDRFDFTEGAPVDIAGVPGKSVPSTDYRELPCSMPSHASVLWVDGTWLIEAVPIDGDIDRAVAVAAAISPDLDSSRLVLDGDAGLEVMGDLAYGWTVPVGSVLFNMSVTDGDWGNGDGLFNLTILHVDGSQQGAILGRMLDDPGDTATQASTPVYDESFGPTRQLDVDGKAVWVGGWGIASEVAMIEGDPGIVVFAGANSGGEGSAGLPSAAQLGDIAAGVRSAGPDEVQAAIDRGNEMQYDRALDNLDQNVRFPGSGLVVDDDWGRMVMSFEWDPTRPVYVGANRAFLPDGRPWEWSERTWNDQYRVTPDDPMGSMVVEIPRRATPTLSESQTPPLGPSGNLDVMVVAAGDVEITVEIAGEVVNVPMNPIERVLTNASYSTGELETLTSGERWGHLVVDAAALDPEVAWDQLAIIARRDGVEVARTTAATAGPPAVPIIPGDLPGTTLVVDGR